MKNYLIAWLPRWLQFNIVLFYKERNDANSVAEKKFNYECIVTVNASLSHRFRDGKFSMQIPLFCDGDKCIFRDLNPTQNR